MASAMEIYKKRKSRYERLLKRQRRYFNLISNLRLIVFILGATISGVLFYYKNYYLLISLILAAAVIFIYLVYIHQHIEVNIKYTSTFCAINEDSIKRLNGEWKSFRDNGDEFIDRDHNYSYDLDIFGEGSLFQWINSAITFYGRQKLRRILTEKPESIEVIKERQGAIKELSQKLSLRQRVMAEGLMSKDKIRDPQELVSWSEDVKDYILKREVKLFLRVLPAVTVSTIIVYFIFNVIPLYIPVVLLLVQYGILMFKSKERSERLSAAEKYSNDIKVYEKVLEIMGKREFDSACLTSLKSKLYSKDGISAAVLIKRLSRIAESLSNRHNGFYFIINVLTLSEYHTYIKLETWKRNWGWNLRYWLDVIGEVECLSSLSAIEYDNPDWTVPEIGNGSLKLVSGNMGHPLIEAQKRVCNDLSVRYPSSILLITGSNMSGKSTLLRTAGVNLVLTYCGTAVCADFFQCTLMDIYSCMRVSDNLENNVSSFYAELLKIKKIVTAAENGENVFFLLDEIFKGTNSVDRHTGAAILVKQLSRQNCIGLVSTHDLELAGLEGEDAARVKNYHFTEYYRDNQILFDYKLNPGVSKTRNAVYLMGLAGIKFDNTGK
jgi:Mismatch repair ATPase (MutS family)